MGLLTKLYAYTLLVLSLVAVLSLAIVDFGNALLSPLGFHVAFSEGYSMCAPKNPNLDYLRFGNMTCAYVPGDILVTYGKWPADVNSIACGLVDNVGVVCHRVSYADQNKVCLKGDAPGSYPEFCVGRDRYYGQVVAKLPRFIGLPGLALADMVAGVSDFLHQVNEGKYPGLGR